MKNRLTTIAEGREFIGSIVSRVLSGQSAHCNCIGPQHGAPVCPCQMRDVVIEGGRYVLKRDLGPAGGSTEAFAAMAAQAFHGEDCR